MTVKELQRIVSQTKHVLENSSWRLGRELDNPFVEYQRAERRARQTLVDAIRREVESLYSEAKTELETRILSEVAVAATELDD